MKGSRTPIDKDAARRLRTDLLEAVERGELTIQAAVKQMRKVARMNQEDFAAHRGVGVKVIKDIERGVANPTVGTLNKIGQFFGLEVAFVRSESLHGETRTIAAPAGAQPPASASAGTSWAVPGDARRLMDELESIKQMATPSIEVQRALQDMRADLVRIVEAQKTLEQQRQLTQVGLEHADLAAAKRKIEADLRALDEARKVIASAERMQQLLQPPPALQQWLRDVEAARQQLSQAPLPAAGIKKAP
jgi:transcriptional regulator with XRE-family HTH domain